MLDFKNILGGNNMSADVMMNVPNWVWLLTSVMDYAFYTIIAYVFFLIGRFYQKHKKGGKK